MTFSQALILVGVGARIGRRCLSRPPIIQEVGEGFAEGLVKGIGRELRAVGWCLVITFGFMVILKGAEVGLNWWTRPPLNRRHVVYAVLKVGEGRDKGQREEAFTIIVIAD